MVEVSTLLCYNYFDKSEVVEVIINEKYLR